MLQARTRWLLPEIDPVEAELLARELRISPLVARLLIHRGIVQPEQALRFLYPSAEQLSSPFVLPGMEEMVTTLRTAINRGHPIVVYTADHADAILGASLMIHTVRRCNGMAYPVLAAGGELPRGDWDELKKFGEYLPVFVGLSLPSMSQLEPGGMDPICLNRSQRSGETGSMLALSAVAFKMAHGLWQQIPYGLLDLAALGTIAAEVPLWGENRVMVKLGLEYLNRTEHPGLRELKRRSGLSARSTVADIQTDVLPYLQFGRESLDLLVSEDEQRVKFIADSLHGKMKEPFSFGKPEGSETSIDAICEVKELTVETIEQLNRLAPFGPGNPSPTFMIQQAEIRDLRLFGITQQDFKCTCRQGEDTIEAVGSGCASLMPAISRQATADLAGEVVIYEWNGIRKPQFWIRDLRIDHMQIFDFRGTREKREKLLLLAAPDSVIVCFRAASMEELQELPPGLFSVILVEEQMDWTVPDRVTNLILYDLPYSLDQLGHFLSRSAKPSRMYCLFGHEHQNRLAALPSRDQFKWLYRMLVRRGSLPSEWIPRLAQAGGVSEEAVRFMLYVFVDLEIVHKNAAGVFMPVPSPEKKDLSQSIIYQRKKQELELETELLYSSFDVLCRTLNQVTLMIS